ncbi:MAG: EAL domain-containing protein [Burkholderiaceae bacterium]
MPSSKTTTDRPRESDPGYPKTARKDDSKVDGSEQMSALQRIFGGHCAPVILVRPETGAILYANEAACTFYGYEPAELIGMTVEQLSIGSNQAVRAIRQKALEGLGRSLNIRHRLADGSERSLLAHSSTISIDGENLLLSILQDVTPLYVARDALRTRQQQLDLVVSASNSGTVSANLLTGELEASDTVWDLLGIGSERPRTLEAFSKLVHPDEIEAVTEHRWHAVEHHQRFERRFRLRRADGQYVWVLGTAKAVYDDNGRAIQYVGSVRDISFTKRIEADLRASESRYRSMFEASPMPMLVVDEESSQIIEANESAVSLYGRDLSGGTTSIAELIDGKASVVLKKLFGAETHSSVIEMQHCGLNSQVLDVVCRSCAIGTAGRKLRLVMIQDLTKSKADESEIERLASIDRVTGLPNRVSFESYLEQSISVADNERKTGSLIVVNLDSFSAVNETLGRGGADLVLAEIGRRLASTAGPNDIVARLEADKFAVLCHGIQRNAKLIANRSGRLANALREHLKEPCGIDGVNFNLSASIGIATFGGAGESPEVVIKRGESGATQAKRFGGDGVRFFDPKIQLAIDERASLELDLRRAVTESQFELYYQLQVDQNAHPVGAEVLLRWNHPERGLVPPFQFIELAEETGVIVTLGQWVLEQACQRLAQWADDPEYSHLRISVNVSARQFRQPDFVSHVTNILATTGASPELLTLELTESLLLDYADEAIEKMQDLRSLGVGFSLDDFGTGYSSLAYLKKLPLDELKIDRGFIRDILTDQSDAVIVRTIIGMAVNLGLSLIAEGVECAAQHRLLTQWGCTGFQGYHFGRPEPIASFSIVPLSGQVSGESAQATAQAHDGGNEKGELMS